MMMITNKTLWPDWGGVKSHHRLAFIATIALSCGGITTDLHTQQRPDPTAPPGADTSRLGQQHTSPPLPAVQMVRHSNGKRSAYIGERWSFTGETVAGARIEAIQSDGVRVSTQGEHYFIPVIGHGVDKNRLLPKNFREAKEK